MEKKNNFIYPAMLSLTNKQCILIGGGPVALRKVKTLLDAGANVTVIAPSFVTEIEKLREKISLIKRNFKAEDLQGVFLVIAATDNFEINREITALAPCLVNNVMEPELNTFIVPSRFNKGDI